jgi:hypothetical protein
MSAVAELTDTLIAFGMTPGAAAALVARAGAELAVPTISKAAMRTRRWREKRPSPTVTERHAVTPENGQAEPSPTVTERHQPSRGDGAHIYTSSSISQKDSVKEEERLEAPRPKKASRLPADWQLEQRHIDYAISKGVTRERVPVLGEKFKNHWWAATGKGSTSPNWFLKWCTWVMNEVEWNGTNGSKSRQDRTAQTPRNGAAGQDAILAGMGRLAARVAERGASERRDREVSDDDDASAGYDARLV